MKRVALFTATLFGAMLALQPAVASAEDRYGDGHRDRGYHRDYDRSRNWREHEWREQERWRDHDWREHEWREHEWREHGRYYGGSVYFYGGGPGYSYGYGYAPPPCR